MNKLFTLQLIVSFIVGGGIIAILSFLAERVNKRIAGIILAFPSTVALGFFFLGWTLSPEEVTIIVPATLIPLGLSVLFAAIYSYTAEYFSKITNSKIWQIIISFIVSNLFWFALAVPVITFQLKSIWIGMAGYLLLISVTHLLLRRKNYHKPVTLTYTPVQKIGRAAFAGFIVFLVVFLGKSLNPFWGGMFAMFPASFLSFMVILHWYYDPKSLYPTIQKVAVGSISIFAYAITVMLVFPMFGFVTGTLIAYAISLIVTLLLMKFQPRN